MDLEELRAVQVDERGTDSLRPLPDSFYRDVAAYLEALREQRERAAERAADPFDSEDVRRLTDEIETAEEVVEAIYERRVGKVVKRASLAAAGMPADDEGLTAEETALFDDLVGRIEANRREVFAAFDGETGEPTGTGGAGESTERSETGEPTEPVESGEPTETGEPPGGPTAADSHEGAESSPERPSPGPDDGADREPSERPTSDPERARSDAPSLDASAAMGEAGESPPDPEGDETGIAVPAGGTGPAEAAPNDGPGAAPVGRADEESTDADPDPATRGSLDGATDGSADVGEPAGEGTDRATVRITRDVGEIYGVDERVYELGEGDVVTLPAENARPLVDRDAARLVD